MTIKIDYFSDVLCIWAYAGQVRLDKLKREFADDISIENRFVPIFGAGKQHVAKAWKDKGGQKGFNAHLKQVVEQWPHITISPDLWTQVAPASSSSAHCYLKAIQLMESQNEIESSLPNGRTIFEEAIWLFRDGFFRQGLDVSRRVIQDEITGDLGVSIERVHELIDSGQAHAALHLDDNVKNKYAVSGSPTFVLNEGRQILYGNVGYRILGANVRELLNSPDNEASWC